MRSSSTQIANQSVCVGGEYWDVWTSGSNSQPASQIKPDRKGIGPLKRDSIPTMRVPVPGRLDGLPYSPIYIKPLCLLDIGRTTARATDAAAGRRACSWCPVKEGIECERRLVDPAWPSGLRGPA